jgi:antitoxin CcdA
MRMKKPRRNREADELKEEANPYRHSGHIGPGPKTGPKRAVNVSVDAEILAAAKAQGINLSQTLEDELLKRTQEAREAKWREQNREAFEAHNHFIEEHGIWSKKYRSW